MEEYPSFMTCILRIDITAHRWQRTIDKVLANVDGVRNFRMNAGGMIEISGTVYPYKFLKILGKLRNKVELCDFRYGECSSNLFLPPRPVDYGGMSNKYGGPNNMLISSLIGQKEAEPGYYGGRDGRFLHYGDKHSQLKKSKDSSKEKANHDHDHNHSHVHKGTDHHHNHVQGRDHNHNHDHNHSQVHIHGGDHNHNRVQGRDHNHIHGRDHNHNDNHVHGHGHDKERDYRNHDQLFLHVEGGKRKHERKLEHAAGYINATTPRPKVQLDCEKQMKGRAEPLQSQGVNSCCLM